MGRRHRQAAAGAHVDGDALRRRGVLQDALCRVQHARNVLLTPRQHLAALPLEVRHELQLPCLSIVPAAAARFIPICRRTNHKSLIGLHGRALKRSTKHRSQLQGEQLTPSRSLAGLMTGNRQFSARVHFRQTLGHANAVSSWVIVITLLGACGCERRGTTQISVPGLASLRWQRWLWRQACRGAFCRSADCTGRTNSGRTDATTRLADPPDTNPHPPPPTTTHRPQTPRQQ